MTFTHTGQDKTQKKNEKRKQMNRDRENKKKICIKNELKMS